MILRTKKVSKIIAIILTILVVSSICVPASVDAASATTYDITKTIKGTVSADGKTLTIKGSGEIPANALSSSSAILSKAKRDKIETIIIDGSITVINRGAFSGCTKLKNLTLKEGLKNIYAGAFINSTSLKTVTIPKSVSFIQNGAFSSKTTIKCLNANLKKYSTSGNGYRINDTIMFNGLLKYDLADSLYNAINKRRASSKLVKLTMDKKLQDDAMSRAAELVVLFSHTRPNGEKYITINEYVLAEVIDESTKTNMEAVLNDTLKNSKNKSIVMNKDYRYIGIGCVQYKGRNYIVQLYSKKRLSSTNYKPMTEKSASFAIFYPQGTGTIKLPYEAITNISGGTRQKLAAGRSYTHPFKINTGNIKLLTGETKTAQLTSGVVLFANSNDKIKSAKWSSENSKVATVSAKGVITGINSGTTRIWAGTALTKRASIEVSVRNKIRLFGQNRYATSIEIANRLKRELGVSKFSSVMIATGANYPDALSGAYLGKVKKAPLILLHKDNPQSITNAINYIKSNVKAGGTVYILGGAGVVPTSIESKLRTTHKVKRLGGGTRYDTNILILKEAGVKNTDLLVTTSLDFRDPLIASSTGYPLLVADNGKLNPAQKNFLQGRGIKSFTIIGNTRNVPASIQNDLKRYSKNVSRITGANSFEISKKVAEKYVPSPKGIILAIENNYPDALAGGPLCIYTKSPLFLVNNSNYAYAKNYAKAKKVTKGYVLGGTMLISDATVRNVLMW